MNLHVEEVSLAGADYVESARLTEEPGPRQSDVCLVRADVLFMIVDVVIHIYILRKWTKCCYNTLSQKLVSLTY